MLVSKSVHKCLAGSTCGWAEKWGPPIRPTLHFSGPTVHKVENTWQKTTGEEEAGASPAGMDE